MKAGKAGAGKPRKTRKTRKTRKGRLIVFEGLDASGKKTQCKLFAKRLLEQGKRVVLMRFPAYETRFGQLVAEYLKGDLELSPHAVAVLYALDRLQFKKEIERHLREGVFVVSDRYTPSNLYQAARIPRREQTRFIKWLRALEEPMPRADAVVFLLVPPQQSALLLEKRGARKDAHEKNLGFQRSVHRLYKRAAKDEHWLVINCVKNDRMSEREEIARLIWSALKKKRIV